MNLKMLVSVMLGLLGVVLTIIALPTINPSGPSSAEWTTVGQAIAPVIMLIGILAVAIIVIVKR